MQADDTVLYKARFKVLKNMSLAGILGMNFLLDNDACIDIAGGVLTLDGKHYEIIINNTNNEFDDQLILKTRINASLKQNLNLKVKELIKKYKLINKPLGMIKYATHHIDLQEKRIINLPSYRISPRMIQLVDEEIKKLITLGVVRPSKSAYCSPAFPILKRNGKVRLVIDFRRLNKITEPTPYIFPNINDILTQLHNSTI